MPEDTLSAEEVCDILSISSATVLNWVRLGKLNASDDGKTFKRSSVESLLNDIRSGKDGRLKSRRNKKNAVGKALYTDYIHNEDNIAAVEKMLSLCEHISEYELRVILAYFAAQLFGQIRSKTQDGVFDSLRNDLLGGSESSDSATEIINFISDFRLTFVPTEDTLGFVYISLRDLSERKQTGSYYTPEKTVSSLIGSLLDCTDIKGKTICDPCCGTGNFLIGLLNNGVKADGLYGQDIDEISVFIARINVFLLSVYNAENIPSRELLTSHIVCGNTLKNTFDKKFYAVLGNPPWGYDFSKEDMKYLLCHYLTAKENGMESYDLFIEKGFAMLEQNGCMAYVLPETLMNTAAHRQARKCIIENGSFKFVTYLGNAFSGVQCPSVILGIQKDAEGSTENCVVSMNGTSFTISTDRAADESLFSFTMNDSEYRCLNTIASVKNAAYLAGNAKFALGIVTGNNKEYVRKTKEAGYETVLKGSDILRYSVKESDNYIRFDPEAFQQVAPTEMYRAGEKLLYRFICEVPVFAYDNRQTLSLNSCNILIPQIKGLDIKYILAVLNSSAAAYFITKKFNSVKLLRSHIEALPIPVISAEKQKPFIKKADRMINSDENISGLYKELDDEIMDLYSLSKADRKIIRASLAEKNFFLKQQG